MTRRDGKSIRALASSIGDFIRYWGFRRIHGEIWTLVYLSTKPLSGVEISRTLGVSKALVSPALSELLSHKLILNAGGDLKTKLYTANSKVIDVIVDVLAKRESVLLKNAQVNFSRVEKSTVSQPIDIDSKRLSDLGSMISLARVGLDMVVKNIKHRDLALLKKLTQ